jgi:hypothetical protein
VVGVMMADLQQVEVVDAPVPQGLNDVAVGPRVDQGRLAFGGAYQDRVASPDVEDVDGDHTRSRSSCA